MTHTLNAVGHFDVAGPDPAALAAFYGALFGWTIHDKGPGYALIETPAGTPGGAIVQSPEAALTIGLVVPDLDRVLDLAARQGGALVMPATDNGWVRKAQIRDPAGNTLTLIQG